MVVGGWVVVGTSVVATLDTVPILGKLKKQFIKVIMMVVIIIIMMIIITNLISIIYIIIMVIIINIIILNLLITWLRWLS